MSSDPGREKVIAPIMKLESTDDQLTRLSAILLPLEDMQNFFLRHDNYSIQFCFIFNLLGWWVLFMVFSIYGISSSLFT